MKFLFTILILLQSSAFTHARDAVIDYPWNPPETIEEDRLSRLELELGVTNTYWKFDTTKSDQKYEVWYEIRAKDGQFHPSEKFVLGSVGPKKGFLSFVLKKNQFSFSTPTSTKAELIHRADFSEFKSTQTDYSQHDKGFLLRFYDASDGVKNELYRIRWKIQKETEQDDTGQPATDPESK